MTYVQPRALAWIKHRHVLEYYRTDRIVTVLYHESSAVCIFLSVNTRGRAMRGGGRVQGRVHTVTWRVRRLWRCCQLLAPVVYALPSAASFSSFHSVRFRLLRCNYLFFIAVSPLLINLVWQQVFCHVLNFYNLSHSLFIVCGTTDHLLVSVTVFTHATILINFWEYFFLNLIILPTITCIKLAKFS